MRKYIPFIVPFLFLAACLILTPWRFDFPLNDDWTYAIPVTHLLQDGKLILSDLAASTQITHVLWGALWAKAFGLDFGILRLSTIALGTSSLFFFYLLLKECRVEDKNALLGVACLAFNPIYFVLSNTFMTDVPYLFWMILSLYCYARHINTGSESWLWGAGVAASACYLTRQIGFFLPLGYCFMLFRERKLDLRTFLKIWILPAAAISGHYIWFNFMHGPTWASLNYVTKGTLQHMLSPGKLVSDIIQRVISSAIEIGFFILPLTAGLIVKTRQFFRKKSPANLSTGVYLASAIFIFACLIYIAVKGSMPHLENTLNTYGLGTITVGGANWKASGIFGKTWFWNLITVLGIVSMTAFMATFASIGKTKEPAQNRVLNLVLYVCCFQFAFSMLGLKFFDRYLLTLLPCVILVPVFAANTLKFSRSASFAVLFLIAALSWAGTKDYFAWNKAKWEAGHLAESAGIPLKEVANGFDWDGYWNYEQNMAILKSVKPLRAMGEWEWQSMIKFKAMTSFTLMPDRMIGEAQYSTPLSSSQENVYLLEIGR